MTPERSLPYLLRVVLLAGAICASGSAAAEDAVPQSNHAQRAYAEAIDQAFAEYEAKNFAEARAHFTRAHALIPSARTLYGLGTVAFELREYATCIAHLEEALLSPVRPLRPGLRTEVEALLTRARTYVARVRLRISPSMATVYRDRLPVTLGSDETLVLDMGEHDIEVRADSFRSERRRLRAVGGEETTVDITLVPSRVATRPVYKRAWFWSVVGAVVAGSAIGTVLAFSRRDELQQGRVFTGNTGYSARGPSGP